MRKEEDESLQYRSRSILDNQLSPVFTSHWNFLELFYDVILQIISMQFKYKYSDW